MSSGTGEIQWSVITVSYNSAHDLAEFWKGYRADRNLEWIVVDNASDDDSVAVAERLGARVISLQKNLGFGGANNIGFHSSRGRYVVFVNPDVSLKMSDLATIADHLDIYPKDLASPQLIHPGGGTQPNGRGMPYLAYKILNRLRPRALEGRYLMIAAEDEVRTCDWLMGAVVAGARQHLKSLGPWDTRFFVYYEDSDLGLRNKLAGGRSVVLGSIRWVHGWARETKTASASAWRREIPSLLKFYSRYPRLLGVPRSRVVEDGGSRREGLDQ